MRWFLFPFAVLYYLVVQIRNQFFDLQLFKAREVPSLVISVGNISAGGTGKTPLTAVIAKTLQELNFQVSIVSRGYRGQYTERAVKVDVDQLKATDLYGDEPVMLAQQLKIPVYVGRARLEAAELSIKESFSTAIVMDDGFQHRWLKRNMDIVVFDATETQLQMLPVGRLREPLKNLKRADIVFISRARAISAKELELKIDLLSEYGFSQALGNLFFLDFKISNIVHVHTQSRLMGSECFLVSAIGKPLIFESSMRSTFDVQEHFVFSDHHQWTQTEWDELLKKCRSRGSLPIVMTEKDAVKIRYLNSDDYPIYYTQTEVIMDKNFDLKKKLLSTRFLN